MEHVVVIYESHCDDFYAVMGEYFAHREYAQEFGGWQFYTKKGATWFVMLTMQREVIGFCSIIRERTHNHWDNFYFRKAYRGLGLSRKLYDLRQRYSDMERREVRVITDTPIQIARYERNGFVFAGMRGRYSKYTKRYDQGPQRGGDTAPHAGALGAAEAQPLEPEQGGQTGNGAAGGEHLQERLLLSGGGDR